MRLWVRLACLVPGGLAFVRVGPTETRAPPVPSATVRRDALNCASAAIRALHPREVRHPKSYFRCSSSEDLGLALLSRPKPGRTLERLTTNNASLCGSNRDVARYSRRRGRPHLIFLQLTDPGRSPGTAGGMVAGPRAMGSAAARRWHWRCPVTVAGRSPRRCPPVRSCHRARHE